MIIDGKIFSGRVRKERVNLPWNIADTHHVVLMFRNKSLTLINSLKELLLSKRRKRKINFNSNVELKRLCDCIPDDCNLFFVGHIVWTFYYHLNLVVTLVFLNFDHNNVNIGKLHSSIGS